MFTNGCLPKYFFGDKMNQNDQSDKNILNYSEDVHLSEPNLSSIPSPSSSLASTKKLEWDSGADIGYIFDSRKSKSYPSLNMDPETSKPKNIDTKNIRTLACIGEGDALKSPKSKNKKAKSFKHSTPYYYRQIKIYASAGDSSNEKATSPINIYEIKDECLQTTLIHRSSKEVQTDDYENVDRKQIKDKSLQTDIRDILGPQSMSSSSSSKSGSFKYIPGSEFAQNSQSLSNGTIKSGTIKSSSYSTSSRKDETDSGSCSPLGQMISTQYSKDLIADIDKSLDILQKFIKSKNYSNDTKKHYAKKIVTKIITNRYSDDTESSSGIQTPPTNNEDQVEDRIKTDDQADSSMEKKYVECGIQCDEINKKSQIISERSECKIKESLEKLNALQTDLKNWRDAQTLSEKLFEARKSHKSRSKKSNEQFTSSSSSSRVVEEEKRDYLIQHSKNERKRQLSWINNEMSYLQKLKELLQLREQSKSNTASTSSSSNRKADSRQNLDDVERQFNEEFGLAPKDMQKVAADKLSTYLTNEQIKFILEHDVHGRPQPERKAALNSSYNSHKNSIYGGDVRKRTQHTSSSDLNQKTTVAVDTATQYSNRVNMEPTNMAAQIQPPFCEIVPTNKVEQSCSSSEYDESVIIDKENIVERCPHKTTTKFNKGGTAYFLTFEEESMSEFDNEERKVLEQVVVKIPKYHRSTRKTNKHNNNSNNNNKSETCTRTLEEYLLKNRPNFVRTANWRWTQVRSLDSQEKQNVFTCHEMKEMTQRKYKNLPEIQEKIKNNKTQNERKHNRFMANIFSKKLQKKTLQGHICLATCKNVMASE